VECEPVQAHVTFSSARRATAQFPDIVPVWLRLRIGSVDHESDIWIAGKLQGHVLKLQVSQREMFYDFVTIHGARSIMIGPPLTKLGADLFEIFNQLFKPAVPRIASTGGVKLH